MTTKALKVFHHLLNQVAAIQSAAEREESAGFANSVPVLRRSGFVLSVAALDTYFHEQGVSTLRLHALKGAEQAQKVARYLGRADQQQLVGTDGVNYIRLGISYKTLVAPKAIDQMLEASGLDPEAIWLRAALKLGTRPSRLRMSLELVFDRRNQIAHEGDWDFVQYDFRTMEGVHLTDCLTQVRQVCESFDTVFAEEFGGG